MEHIAGVLAFAFISDAAFYEQRGVLSFSFFSCSFFIDPAELPASVGSLRQTPYLLSEDCGW
jgi:hypothetical protein